MEILLATDADWIVDEVTAALGSPEISFVITSEGRKVSKLVAERDPGAVILDLQIGSMGGFAAAMDLKHDHSSGRLPKVPILLLLDRTADTFIAQQSGADGWIIKPIDALNLKRAIAHITNGEPYPGKAPEPVEAAADELVDAEDADIDDGIADENAAEAPANA